MGIAGMFAAIPWGIEAALADHNWIILAEDCGIGLVSGLLASTIIVRGARS